MTSRNDERPGRPWVHGVAARWELLAAGEQSRAIQARIESGRYLRIYEGVYAIGHADLTVYGRRRAIVLACHNLIVEVDGYTYHRGRRAFTNDRARDRHALRRGERTARFTAVEIVSTPTAVARELRELLNLT